MRLAIAALLILASAVSWGQNDQAKARQLLERGMSRKPTFNVRALIVQRTQYNSPVMEQVKVEMSKAGKFHQIVLAPLSMQGYECVDDGVWSKTYLPDERMLIIQGSPRATTAEVKFRMELVDRNYRLTIDRKEVIAGRSAFVVQAEPKHRELETRCYAIDEKTGFLLRIETCRPDAAPAVHMEAKFVEYPKDLCDDIFRLKAMGVSTKRYEPKSLSRAKISEAVGFTPAIPANLPLGFVVQDIQTDSGSNVRSVSIRLTDGLAKATVYQWPSHSRDRAPAPEGTTVGDVGRLRILVSGDVPDEIRDQILGSFLSAARSPRALNIPAIAMSWVQELGCSLYMFPLDRGSDDDTPIIFDVPVLIHP